MICLEEITIQPWAAEGWDGCSPSFALPSPGAGGGCALLSARGAGQDVGGEAEGLSDVGGPQKRIQEGSKTEPGVSGRQRSIQAPASGCLYVAFEAVWAVCSIFLCRRCFVWKVVDTCQR